MALPRLIFTILMIMSNVPSVYPYLASPSAGILLAAGQARATPRSGGADKLLASLPQGPCVAVASARRLRAAVDSVVAVVRPGNAALAALLRAEDCRVIEADPAGEGMGTSWRRRRGICWPCRHAARGAGGAGGYALDSPRQHGGRAGCAATCADGGAVASGTARPSCGFRADLLPRLALLNADEGARRLLGQPGLRLVRWMIQACCSISTRPPTWTGQAERRPPARPPWRPIFRAPGFPYLSVR